ncbi:unnamed protein product [Blepharisma stoltei]|uniref:Uncharacterized protein n=1 Tax=Blepharisma stoltei TaxID=1481888 RepID=A0AAU9IWV0_9CILI|nr:unnamed protein product [Blepharisma stoltei]
MISRWAGFFFVDQLSFYFLNLITIFKNLSKILINRRGLKHLYYYKASFKIKGVVLKTFIEREPIYKQNLQQLANNFL